MHIRKRSGAGRRLLAAAVATAWLAASMTVMAGPAASATGGPMVLMGIDAEDGGPGSHGPILSYQNVANSIKAKVTNGGGGILVVGGGKSASDAVTRFWNAIGAGTSQAVTYVNGAANISSRSLAGFAMIGVASSVSQTPSGGLTQAENDALAARQNDVANFVNGGGGLLGFSQSGLSGPYAYITPLGNFTFNLNTSYSNINPTAEGTAVGVTNALDVCCWHDEYLTFPSFLQVLATNASTGKAAALGGTAVVIEANPCLNEPTPKPGDIVGTAGDDKLMGTNGPDRIFGLGGNDQITGLGDDDVIFGGPGSDQLYGDAGKDTLCGGDGRDYLFGGDGHDTLYGVAGDDDLAGGNGDDALHGGEGNDRLAGGSGTNTNDGGPGTDACVQPSPGTNCEA